MLLLLVALLVLQGCAASPETVPATAAPSATAPAEATAVPARGYVLVTAGQEARWFPLPSSGEVSFTVKQQRNGEEQMNLIHLTPEGVYMEASTCSNQDCVEQGVVTLENRESRVLGSMVICLPNQVSLELYTPEELLSLSE